MDLIGWPDVILDFQLCKYFVDFELFEVVKCFEFKADMPSSVPVDVSVFGGVSCNQPTWVNLTDPQFRCLPSAGRF